MPPWDHAVHESSNHISSNCSFLYYCSSSLNLWYRRWCLDLLGTVPSTFGTTLKTPTTFLCGTHRHKTCPFPLAPITMAMHVTRQHYLGINTLPNTPSPHSMLSAMGTNGHRIASSILLLPRSMYIEWFPPTFQMCRYPSHNPAR